MKKKVFGTGSLVILEKRFSFLNQKDIRLQHSKNL